MGQHGSASGRSCSAWTASRSLAAEVVGDEWRLAVQTTGHHGGLCGLRQPSPLHGRRTVRVRDLPIGGRPVVLAWRKRIWRCREPACGVRTWTEQTVAIRPRAVLTERARAEACRRVGKDAHAVAAVARDLGVGWATIMRAVARPRPAAGGRPGRLDGVAALGLDETSFLKATRRAHPVGHRPGRPGGWSAAGCGGRPHQGRGGRLARRPAPRTGWPRSARSRWTPGAAMPARWSPRWPRHRGGGPLPRHPAGQHGGRPGPPSRPSRPPSATGAASAIRCTASASCC